MKASPAKPPYSFERNTEMSFDESMREIGDWHEANPEPTGIQLADRLFWRFARLYADEPDRFGRWLHEQWIGRLVTLRQAATLGIPMMREVFGDDRCGFVAWSKRWFVEHGLSKEEVVAILKNAKRDSERKEAS